MSTEEKIGIAAGGGILLGAVLTAILGFGYAFIVVVTLCVVGGIRRAM